MFDDFGAFVYFCMPSKEIARPTPGCGCFVLIAPGRRWTMNENNIYIYYIIYRYFRPLDLCNHCKCNLRRLAQCCRLETPWAQQLNSPFSGRDVREFWEFVIATRPMFVRYLAMGHSQILDLSTRRLESVWMWVARPPLMRWKPWRPPDSEGILWIWRCI